MDKSLERVIRHTKSACPQCQKDIGAHIAEVDGKVVMNKICPEHGSFVCQISWHPWFYEGLTQYYFDVMPKELKQRRFYIYLSSKCNLDCPICLLEPNQNKFSDVSLPEFEKIIKKHKNARFYLYGTEPTLREDLGQWIRLLKHHGNLVNLHSNGLKLADYDYLQELKLQGVDYVSLQFDGFCDDIYAVLRGKKILAEKLKALENLEKLNIPTGLNVTIAKGVNEEQIGPILEYASLHPFIKDVSFATLSFVGSANKNFPIDALLMPDELIDAVEKQTAGKIARKNVFLFQKLYYALLSIFRIRRCYNFQHIALVRGRGGEYTTFDSLFKMGSFEERLDKFRQLAKRHKGRAALYFFYALLRHFIKEGLFGRIGCLPLSMCLPGKLLNLKIPDRLLLVSFGTVCDFYKYDAQISKYCGQGVCCSDKGEMVLTDTIPDLVLFYKRKSCQ